MGGIGGETRMEIGLINEIAIGEAKRRNWRVLIAGEQQRNTGVFILGNKFFQDHELEFDLSRQRVRLFKSQDCRGESLAYWAQSAGEAPIKIDKWITVKLLLNGKPVVAVLDSGAATTLIDASVLTRVGADAQLGTAAQGRCLRGFGKEAVQSQIGEFDSIAIGNEVIRHPKIYFADLRKDVPRDRFLFFQIAVYEMPEMILGADFLHAHRVLISPTQDKMFFTYEGGTVFPIGAAAACPDGKVKPKEPQPEDKAEERRDAGEEGR
jgi:hypothetical protein